MLADLIEREVELKSELGVIEVTKDWSVMELENKRGLRVVILLYQLFNIISIYNSE